MRLYFLRHGTAARTAATDSERPLTTAGEQEARSAGAVLRKLGVEPDHVLSSPLVRALQTARLAAAAVKFEGQIAVLDALKYDASTAEFFYALKPFVKAHHVLVVGHSPSMPEQTAELLGAAGGEVIVLGKGGMACVEVSRLGKGGGVLRWLLRPKQVRFLAG